LLDILACPGCRGPLEVRAPLADPAREIKSAVLFCAACSRIAGAIRNYKYDFLYFDRAAAAARLAEGTGARLDHHVCDREVPFDHPSIRRRGDWEHWDGKYLLNHGRPGDALSFTGEFLDVGLRVLHHPWSGIMQVALDGRDMGEIDLYRPEWSEIVWHPVAFDLSPGPHTLTLTVTGRRNPSAESAQLLLHEIVTTAACSPAEAAAARRRSLSRGLPYFDRVEELMRLAPPGARILDCGGGDRLRDDPRFVNLEFQPYQLPHVYADGLRLPFRDDSFDLIVSQAVLEHVRDPFRAVSEMRRVTRPGGTIWAGMAFLQPVHAAPSHYFNATAWGLEELFRGLTVKELSWFGPLSDTFEWLCRVGGVQKKMPPEQFREMLARVKEADQYVSYEDLRSVASGVAIEATKPQVPSGLGP
jgi:SAM-dependent methyltransferase